MQRAAPLPSRKVCLKALPSPPSKADAKSHVRQSQQRRGGQAPGRAGGCQRGHRLKPLLDTDVLKFFINLGAHNNIDFGGRHVRSKYCSGYSVTHHLCSKYLCPKSKTSFPGSSLLNLNPPMHINAPETSLERARCCSDRAVGKAPPGPPGGSGVTPQPHCVSSHFPQRSE